MATTYSELRGKVPEGERLVFSQLRNKLPDEYMVWHSVTKKHEIDFIILHPHYGMWVAEVKDWCASQILRASDKEFTIVDKGQEQVKTNPLRQAEQNSFEVKELLEKHPELRHRQGSHQGKLVLPINAFVILPNITETEFQEKDLGTYIQPERVWTKDFVEDEYADDREWEKRLLATRKVTFVCNLNDTLLNVIKSEIGVPRVYDVVTGTELGTLDDHQTKLVQLNIHKQVAIEGPAGSGKSVVLLKRALYIHDAQPDWEIGIFCFNTLMANYLRTMLRQERADTDGKIAVYDIFDWASKIGFKTYFASDGGLRRSTDPDTQLIDAYTQSGGKVEKQYDAILIDEGQDSKDIYLKLYRAMLRTPTGSFTFFYDKRQNIYNTDSLIERLHEFGFSLSEKTLVKQQRSVLVLLALGFYERFHEPAKSSSEIMHRVLEVCERMFFDVRNAVLALTTGLGRLFGFKSGSQIDIRDQLKQAITLCQIPSAPEMCLDVAKKIKELTESGEVQYGDMLVVFPKREYECGPQSVNIPQLIQGTFQQSHIPYTYIDKYNGAVFDGTRPCAPTGLRNDNRRNADLTTNTVKVMTIHASKGYDAKYVFVVGFDQIDKIGDSPVAEVGYVALTRAKVHCTVYYHEQSYPVTALLDIVATLDNPRRA